MRALPLITFALLIGACSSFPAVSGTYRSQAGDEYSLAAEPSRESTPLPDPDDPKLEKKLPPLCDLNGGKWCESCGAAGCPQGDSGALCCSGGVCVKWLGGSCSGDLGWCNNYTTERDEATGIEVATCHDG